MSFWCKCEEKSPEPLNVVKKEQPVSLYNLDVTVYFKNQEKPFNIVLKGKIETGLNDVNLWNGQDFGYRKLDEWQIKLGKDSFNYKYSKKRPFKLVINPDRSFLGESVFLQSSSYYQALSNDIKFYPSDKEEIIIYKDTIARIDIKMVEVEKVNTYWYVGEKQ